NPIATRMRQWEAALGKPAFAQPDLTGFKLRGRGWPYQLGSGLLTLVNRSWRPRLLAAVKLSGSRWSFESLQLSLQWRETRYALFVECLHPRWGRCLVVNTHLHHGLELTADLEARLNHLGNTGSLTGQARSELRHRLGA